MPRRAHRSAAPAVKRWAWARTPTCGYGPMEDQGRQGAGPQHEQAGIRTSSRAFAQAADMTIGMNQGQKSQPGYLIDSSWGERQ